MAQDNEVRIKVIADTKQAFQQLRDFGEKLSQIGMRMAAAFTAPLIGAFALAQKNSDALKASMDKVGAAFGNAFGWLGNELAKIINQLMPQINQLANELTRAFTDLGPILQSVLVPALRDLLNALIGVGQWFHQLDPGIKELIVKFVLFAAVMAPVVIAVGQLLVTIGTIGEVIMTVQGFLVGAEAGMVSFGAASVAAILPIAIILGTIVGLIMYLANNTTFKQLAAMWRGGTTALFQGAEAGKTELYNASKEYGLLNQPAPATRGGGGTNITYINNGVDTNNPILNQIMGPIVNNQLRTNGMR